MPENNQDRPEYKTHVFDNNIDQIHKKMVSIRRQIEFQRNFLDDVEEYLAAMDDEIDDRSIIRENVPSELFAFQIPYTAQHDGCFKHRNAIIESYNLNDALKEILIEKIDNDILTVRELFDNLEAAMIGITSTMNAVKPEFKFNNMEDII